jgi:hypothetical protein
VTRLLPPLSFNCTVNVAWVPDTPLAIPVPDAVHNDAYATDGDATTVNGELTIAPADGLVPVTAILYVPAVFTVYVTKYKPSPCDVAVPLYNHHNSWRQQINYRQIGWVSGRKEGGE